MNGGIAMSKYYLTYMGGTIQNVNIGITDYTGDIKDMDDVLKIQNALSKNVGYPVAIIAFSKYDK